MDFFMGVFLALSGLHVYKSLTLLSVVLPFMVYLVWEGYKSTRAGLGDRLYWFALACWGVAVFSWMVNGFKIGALYYLLLMLGGLQMYLIGKRLGSEVYTMMTYAGVVWVAGSFFFPPAANVNALMGLGFLYCALHHPKRNFKIGFMALWFVYLALLGSRTGIVGAVLLVLLMYPPKLQWQRIGVGIGLVVVIGLLAMMRTNTIEARISTWEQGLIMVQEFTWLDHLIGIGPTGIMDRMVEPNGKIPPHAHNLWFTTYLETGLMGLGLLGVITGYIIRFRSPLLLMLLVVGVIDQPFFSANVVMLSGMILGAEVIHEKTVLVPDPDDFGTAENVPTGEGPVLV